MHKLQYLQYMYVYIKLPSALTDNFFDYIIYTYMYFNIFVSPRIPCNSVSSLNLVTSLVVSIAG